MDPDDSACGAAFAQSSPSKAFCQLPRQAWEWTDPHSSIVSEMYLICDHKWLNQLANSAFFAGFFFGAAIWGALSDRFGRRWTLILTCIVSGLVTGLSSLVAGYTALFISRVLQGASAPHRLQYACPMLCAFRAFALSHRVRCTCRSTVPCTETVSCSSWLSS